MHTAQDRQERKRGKLRSNLKDCNSRRRRRRRRRKRRRGKRRRRKKRRRRRRRRRRRSIIPLSDNHLRPCLDDRSV